MDDAGTETGAEGSRSRLQVAVVAPRYPPDLGGMESYARWVATTLAAEPDVDVVVVASRPGMRTRTVRQDGIDVVRLGSWLTLSNTPLSPLWPWQVARLLRRRGVHVVNAHSPVPGMADVAVAVAGRGRSVLTYHAGSLKKGGGLVDVLLGLYERWVLPRVFARAGGLVAVSPVSMASRDSRAVMIPPGVDATVFRPEPGAPRRRSALFVGRIERTSRWKGLHVLLDAWPHVLATSPDAVLEIVGTGDDVQPLRERADRLGIASSVRWHGGLPPESVARMYRGAAVTVLPSLTEAESFGMTLVEAMASGCPVVGSRVGGIPFVIREGVDGLLAEPGDPHDLARAITTVLEDDELAGRLGRGGVDAVRDRWSWSHQREATVRVVRETAAV